MSPFSHADPPVRPELRLLEAVAEGGELTQRSLASRLGIALGLTNIYLKRLVRKGFIKCVNIRANRVRYLITPAGIVEKTRLTYEYMDYSMRLYRDARRRLRSELAPRLQAGGSRVAIFGTGDAAELAYLSLKELGLDPVAVFDRSNGTTFLGEPVRGIEEHGAVEYEVMIVASFEPNGQLVEWLNEARVPPEKLVMLCPSGPSPDVPPADAV